MRAYDLDRSQLPPLFADMRPEAFRKVMTGARRQHVPAGTQLLCEGEAVDCLHVLLEGQAELYGCWDGRETTLAVLQPASTFILAAVVLDADALMSARTLEASDILKIPGKAIRRAMADDLQFAAAVAREVSGGFRTMVRALKNQKLRSGVERLANYLVTAKASQGAGANVVLSHEKRVLASLLGMTPENLSRAFAALRDHGVSVNGAVVTIADLRSLTALSKPDPLIDTSSSTEKGKRASRRT